MTLSQLRQSETMLKVHTINHSFFGTFEGPAFDGSMNGSWLFKIKDTNKWIVVRIEHLVSIQEL